MAAKRPTPPHAVAVSCSAWSFTGSPSFRPSGRPAPPGEGENAVCPQNASTRIHQPFLMQFQQQSFANIVNPGIRPLLILDGHRIGPPGRYCARSWHYVALNGGSPAAFYCPLARSGRNRISISSAVTPSRHSSRIRCRALSSNWLSLACRVALTVPGDPTRRRPRSPHSSPC